MNNIQAQIDFYDKNKSTIDASNNGKVVIIGSDMAVQAYQTLEEAYAASIASYGYGNFLMKDLTKGTGHVINMINPSITTAL